MPPHRSAPHPAAASAVRSPARLAALRQTALLDADADGSFDRFTRLAGRLLGVPVALVSLVDEDRQFFLSSRGLPAPWAAARETPLTHSFCQHVVAGRAPLAVDDARQHALLATNGAVADLGVVAYLGVPIHVDGEAIGSLCAIDGAPRAWTAEDAAVLTDLVDALRAEIALRAEVADGAAARRTRELLLGASPSAFLAVDADDRCTFATERAAARLGRPVDRLLGRPLAELFSAGDLPDAASLAARVRATGAAVDQEFADADGRWTAAHAVPTAEGGVAMALRDVTARKQRESELRASEARFRAVAATASDAIVTADGAGRIAYWNAAAERIFGYAADEAVGRPLTLIMPAAYRGMHDGGFARVAAGGASRLAGQVLELEGERRSGEVFPVDMSLSVYHVDGAPYFTSIIRDASARRRAEAELRASEARYRAVVEQSPEPVFLHRGGRLVYTNASGARLLGAPEAAALVGADVVDAVHPDDRGQVAAALAAVAVGAAPGAPRHYRVLRADGGVVEVESVSAVVDFDGAPAVQTLARDVTERNRLARQLAHQAFHDPLTGLANRALFLDRLGHALGRRAAAREGDAAEAVAVVYVDLDDFKTVNDSLGHAHGDALLREVAERLRRATRGCDTVARLGGDEFAVLLEGMAGARDAAVVVERVLATLAHPVALGEGAAARVVRAGASVGVAYARGGETAEGLLRDADVAMYRAKGAGKGRHAVFEPAMHAALVARLELEADLRRALEAPAAGGLWVAYQPIVDLRTGRVQGFEALARWDRAAEGAAPGPVSPAQFVPVAEESGLVAPLGRWVLREACAQVARWRRAFPGAGGLRLSVNVSGRQLGDLDALAADVRGALAGAGLEPSALVLEMTESVLMQRTDDTLRRLAALKALGVQLAVDDFGTGYSSLAYLQRFPVDVLKIDKAFVDGVATEAGDRAIARTVVALGQALGLRVVAEGVERDDQRRALAAMGCGSAQGYLFGRPLAAEGAEALLAGAAPAAPARRAAALSAAV